MYAGGRGGGGGGAGGRGMEEDQKLDRTQTRVVLIRSFRMAGEFRKQAVLALGLVIITVLCTLAGPVLVRHGIDAGIRAKNAHALNMTVIAYIVVVVIAYIVGRWQYVALNSAGEGFLRLIRIRVFSRMQKQSMA
ncbi:MAG: ABC transporter ATP-binding protein, partial [Actinobacteria bacterium]|nr:ABC transporter ATP-binding protein [Actinomycetota bacterium]